ncbi:MAG: division/cell wall cluster transcriptional repressor MraZ [Desulfuromonadales bacterium]|jgi:MraZ protein|nr:division/cell wall cluster transcriptional repressor MraZ [Desulfuromonadales bacterium]
MNFQGIYYNSIDAKGRASIPARFREVLKEAFGDDALVVTQDRSGIAAYPVSAWEKFLEKFDQLPNDQFREDLYLTTVTPATHCTFDKQGRIQLPQALREFCQMDTDGMRDVVVVGGDSKIHIWNKIKYLETQAEAQKRVEENRQKRFDLGL